MKESFKGWNHVFAFTFRQATKGKGFKKFINTKSSATEITKNFSEDDKTSIAVHITESEAGYRMEAIIPESSMITSDNANDLLWRMTHIFETYKFLQAGLSEEQLTRSMKPVQATFHEVGEEESEFAYVIRMVAPMFFGLLLLLMLILYGETISKSVSTEKTSRLVETLLTSVHPYAMITGKVLAITTMALLQFVSWILSGVTGLFVGNVIAQAVYPNYQNPALVIIAMLKDNLGEMAFSIPAIILSIIFFYVGFLFYSMIAGLTGCLVSKPEDVSSTQMLFQFPVIISFTICYLSPLWGNEMLQAITRYIPFTAPFCVPVDLITGTIGLVEGMVTLVFLMVFTYFVVLLSGRVYRGLILHMGQKVNWKTLRNVLKANR